MLSEISHRDPVSVLASTVRQSVFALTGVTSEAVLITLKAVPAHSRSQPDKLACLTAKSVERNLAGKQLIQDNGRRELICSSINGRVFVLKLRSGVRRADSVGVMTGVTRFDAPSTAEVD